jgi:CheY-like chemotaxis protein
LTSRATLVTLSTRPCPPFVSVADRVWYRRPRIHPTLTCLERALWWKAPPMPTPTVLVVDDNDDIREALQLLFTDEGISVVSATSGERALELLHALRGPVVVLFDFLMPEGDGLDLLRAVAADASLQRCYAYVCVTAVDRSRLPADFTTLLEDLRVPLITKPFDLDGLLQTINAAHHRLMVTCPAP